MEPLHYPSVNSCPRVRTAVLSHMSLAIASDWMFAPELADGAVQRVLEDWNFRGSIFGRCSPPAGWQVQRRARSPISRDRSLPRKEYRPGG